MSYDFATLYQQRPIFIDERREQEERMRFERRSEGILRYAERRYNCEFSEEFQADIQKGNYRSCDIPGPKVIDALVEEWKVWKPYVSEDSFSRFIEDGIKSIIAIQATATFHSPNFRGFIGNKADVIKELPTVLATSVSRTGVLCINGKQVR